MRDVHVEGIVFKKKNKKFEFLLLKRVPKKGGFWQPITGGVEEKDNSILEAALRELNEEANIQKEDIVSIIPDVHYFEMKNHYLTGESISITKEYVFGFEVKSDFIVSIEKNICHEHEEIKWVSFEEALLLLKWENNKDAFKKLNKILLDKL